MQTDQKSQLPAGWTEASPGGMATNTDPVNGGIIDENMTGLGWFVIFNRDGIEQVEGLASRDEAFRVFEDKLKSIRNQRLKPR